MSSQIRRGSSGSLWPTLSPTLRSRFQTKFCFGACSPLGQVLAQAGGGVAASDVLFVAFTAGTQVLAVMLLMCFCTSEVVRKDFFQDNVGLVPPARSNRHKERDCYQRPWLPPVRKYFPQPLVRKTVHPENVGWWGETTQRLKFSPQGRLDGSVV